MKFKEIEYNSLFGSPPKSNIFFIAFVAILFLPELMATERLARELKQDFDSVSRYVLAGHGTSGVVRSHLGLQKAMQRTVLGRTEDAAKRIEEIAHRTLAIAVQPNQSIAKHLKRLGRKDALFKRYCLD